MTYIVLSQQLEINSSFCFSTASLLLVPKTHKRKKIGCPHDIVQLLFAMCFNYKYFVEFPNVVSCFQIVYFNFVYSRCYSAFRTVIWWCHSIQWILEQKLVIHSAESRRDQHFCLSCQCRVNTVIFMESHFMFLINKPDDDKALQQSTLPKPNYIQVPLYLLCNEAYSHRR